MNEKKQKHESAHHCDPVPHLTKELCEATGIDKQQATKVLALFGADKLAQTIAAYNATASNGTQARLAGIAGSKLINANELSIAHLRFAIKGRLVGIAAEPPV